MCYSLLASFAEIVFAILTVKRLYLVILALFKGLECVRIPHLCCLVLVCCYKCVTVQMCP